MEAAESALPSENLQSYHAMYALKGKSEYLRYTPATDQSTIPTSEKINLLKVCHDELSHLGGFRGVVAALKEEGKDWKNMELDAQWLIIRCPQCRKNSTRDMAKSELRGNMTNMR